VGHDTRKEARMKVYILYYNLYRGGHPYVFGIYSSKAVAMKVAESSKHDNCTARNKEGVMLWFVEDKVLDE
jgi:hypothetical protein